MIRLTKGQIWIFAMKLSQSVVMLAFTSLAILGVNQDTSSNGIVASEHGLRLVAIAAIAFCLMGAVFLFFYREKNVNDVIARGKKGQKSALEAESKE